MFLIYSGLGQGLITRTNLRNSLRIGKQH